MILGDGAVEFGVHCLTNGTVGGIALFFFLLRVLSKFLSSRLPVLRSKSMPQPKSSP